MMSRLPIWLALAVGCGTARNDDPKLAFDPEDDAFVSGETTPSADAGDDGTDAVDSFADGSDGLDVVDGLDGMPVDVSGPDATSTDAEDAWIDTDVPTPNDVMVDEFWTNDLGPSDTWALDVDPGDVDPGDVGPADVDPGDAPGPTDVDPGDAPWEDVDFSDVPPSDVGDAGPPDVPGPDDIAVDVTPDVPPDAAADTTVEDVGPPPTGGRLYRLDSLSWIAPPLCFPSFSPGAACVDITEIANNTLAEIWSDSQDPTDIGIRLASTDTVFVDAVLGGLTCDHDGDTVVSCFVIDPPPPASFEVVWAGAPGGCGELVAPCFQTLGTVASLAIQVGNQQMGLSNAAVSGEFDGDTPDQHISFGRLTGFLPEKIAKTLSFSTGGAAFTLAQLLWNSPKTTVNTQPGWEVELGFTATEVPETEP